MLPYSAPSINEDDIQAVAGVMRSGWLTTGPEIERFEAAFCEYTGAKHAVAVSSGTAALHAAMFALGIGPGDEVIVPSLTFVATANVVVYQGATPVFADVEPDTLLIDPSSVEMCLTERTRAIVAMDYAGQPVNYLGLYDIAAKHNLQVVGDCCHSLGSVWHAGGERGTYKAGCMAALNCFSLHAIKAITSGEGGVVTTFDSEWADEMRSFRNHGREGYEMVSLGHNYRMTDFQAALARSQLGRLDQFIARRREIAAQYDEAFKDGPVVPLWVRPTVEHARHLYTIRTTTQAQRARIHLALRGANIETAVHYVPIHLQPYYEKRIDGLSNTESAAVTILSLPIFPDMKDEDVGRVIEIVKRAGKEGT